MDASSRRLAMVLSAAAVAAVIAALAWYAWSESSEQARLSASTVRPGVGVTVMGRDVPLGGMTRAEALSEVSLVASGALASVSVEVVDSASGRRDTLDAGEAGVAIDATAAVETAWASGRDGAGDIREALRERFMPEDRTAVSLPMLVRVDPKAGAAEARRIARSATRKAADDSLGISGMVPEVRTGRDGYSVEASAVAAAISEAAAGIEVASGEVTATAEYSGRAVPRKAARADALVVSRARRTVTLWKGGKRVRAYPIAVGTAAYPTPRGDFEVTLLRRNPTWINPARSGWGAGMPASIPPGPNSPLGVRAINISASGIRFHGTTAENTVGTAASHGCMRMRKGDILDLFERVSVGMPVYIR